MKVHSNLVAGNREQLEESEVEMFRILFRALERKDKLPRRANVHGLHD